jgi:5'-3' exonuclease
MFSCCNIYSIWDKRLIRGVKNYRRLAKNVEYKGNRDVDKNKHVFSYEESTTELLNCLGIKNMYPGILEADDVIAWLCKQGDERKVIVSVDQDMLQLVSETVDVYSPIKDKHINLENFADHTNVSIDQFLRYKSLIGDKSDNLPGLDKCGPKTAKKLITECPDDDTLIEKIGNERLKNYFVNLEMIDLKQGELKHPEDTKLYIKQYDKLQDQQPDFDTFRSKCESLNLNSIVNRIDDWKQLFTNSNINDKLESIVNSLSLNK